MQHQQQNVLGGTAQLAAIKMRPQRQLPRQIKATPAAADSAAASSGSVTAADLKLEARRSGRNHLLPRHPQPPPGTPCAGSRAARPGRSAPPQAPTVECPPQAAPPAGSHRCPAGPHPLPFLGEPLQTLQEPEPALRIGQRDLGRPRLAHQRRPRGRPLRRQPPASASTLGASNRLRIATSTFSSPGSG